MALTPTAPAVVALTETARPVAAAVAQALGGRLHGRAGRVSDAEPFDSTAEHLRALFAAGTPIIAFCAAGIVIRALAPLLGDKHAEPPVLAVSDDGQSVVPLLGGHRGANDLARRIAAATQGAPAITTAGDRALGLALDSPPEGWALVAPEQAGPAMAALIAGQGARLTGEAADRADWLHALPQGEGVEIRVSARPGLPEHAPALTFRPRRWVLGLGCARDCPPEELAELAAQVLTEADIAPEALAGLATVDLKADEPAMLALARRWDQPLRLFDAETLEAQTPRLATPSEVVFAEIGAHGVSEAAALAAAGAEATLRVTKRKTARATAALAEAPEPITALAGRRRGRVSLVGIGPGQPAWRTPEASRLIAEAEELVGYGFYIDLLGAAAAQKPRADFPLGGEEARCRHALERAGEGVDVALICSGDAGIYAMGALVYELLDRPEAEGGVSDAARRVQVVTAPGVTAMQAAAARAGAPLGHDFCAISLSDLLTPREAILTRIKAAAEGDFVCAFYNPVSKRRRDLLALARETLLAHRPADTPVLLARSLGRPDETLTYRTLSALDVDEVDMMTVVIVGSSASRLVQRGEGPAFYTPRGYAKHLDAGATTQTEGAA